MPNKPFTKTTVTIEIWHEGDYFVRGEPADLRTLAWDLENRHRERIVGYIDVQDEGITAEQLDEDLRAIGEEDALEGMFGVVESQWQEGDDADQDR